MNARRPGGTPGQSDAGRTLAGRYELGVVIGRGGMGTVYRAVDLVLGRTVAVKTLPWLLADQDPTHVARFAREARAAAKLSHPSVVSIYDTGVDGTTHYIVMEFVAGRSLDAVLRAEGALDPERAAGMGAGIAGALEAAHAAGIVHRDIKPANVMVGDDGRVKVLDFGIAHASGSTTLTQASSLIGTAAYMSPEQAMGRPADERSDIYALGCVLYALLTGRPPFTGEGAAAILAQQANGTARPPAEANDRVPAALSALTMQMLAKAPGERPQTAREVRDRLRAAPARRPVAAVASEPTAPTVPVRAPAPTRRMPPHAARPAGATAAVDAASHRRRALAVGAIVAGVLLLALVAFGSGGSSPRRAASTQHRATSAPPTRHPVVSGARRAAAAKKPAAAATAPTTHATAPPRTPTVAAAASALTALVTQDAQAGTIDPPVAPQILTGLSTVLHTWETGGTAATQQQLSSLQGQLSTLEQHGQIAASAAPGLSHALATLGTALASAKPPPAHTPGPGPPAGSPGHGGIPPGQAKKGGGNQGGNEGGD